MPFSNTARLETFARLIAVGYPPLLAAKAAGYRNLRASRAAGEQSRHLAKTARGPFEPIVIEAEWLAKVHPRFRNGAGARA